MRSARPSVSRIACCIRRCAASECRGTTPSTRWPRHSAAASATRPGIRGVLRVGPAAHRGLLRRQQAHEGLHRRGQHRHQLAAVHGIGRGRAQARLRRRRGAGELRRSGPRGSHRAGRVQHRLVSSGPAAAHAGRARATAAARRSWRSIRGAPRPRNSPICTCRCAAGTDVHLFNGLLVWLADHGQVDHGFVDAHTQGCEEALAGGARRWRWLAEYRAGLRPRPRSLLQSSTKCSPRPRR